jgi:hypothetical protein
MRNLLLSCLLLKAIINIIFKSLLVIYNYLEVITETFNIIF